MRKNIKNLYAPGAIFFVAVYVAVLVVTRTAHGAEAPRTPSGEIINLGQAVFNDYKDLTQFALERGFVVTADIKNPKKHNKGSLHSKGLAIDVSIKKHTPEDVEEFMLEAKAAGIRVLDERCRPKKQKKWGGSHVHLEISKLSSTNQKNKCRASRETTSPAPTPAPAPAPTPAPAPAPEPAPVPEPVIVPPPTPEKTPISGSMTSISCNVVQLNGGIGGTVDYYDAIIKGTATGPVDTTIYGGVITCDSWQDCYRGENDPPATNWTDKQRVYVSRDPLANPANNGATTNQINIRGSIVLLPSQTKVCPQ